MKAAVLTGAAFAIALTSAAQAADKALGEFSVGPTTRAGHSAESPRFPSRR